MCRLVTLNQSYSIIILYTVVGKLLLFCSKLPLYYTYKKKKSRFALVNAIFLDFGWSEECYGFTIISFFLECDHDFE